MIELGYALSSEEQEPNELIAHQIGPDQEGFLDFFKSTLQSLFPKEAVVAGSVS